MAKLVAILGPGAIGSFTAGALLKAGHDVTVIGKPETASRIARNGICFNTALFGDMVMRPTASVARLTDVVDVLFITTKAHALLDALSRVREGIGPGTIVIPLINGLEHFALLREKINARIVAGMIGGIVACRDESGCITSYSERVQIEFGSDHRHDREGLENIAELFKGTGITASVLPKEADVIWNKLARLSALSAVTAASGMTLGEIRHDSHWCQKMEVCADEAAAIAVREGVPIRAHDILSQIDALPHDLTTSLSRDIARGDSGEMDAIVGAVIRRAAAHGLSHKGFDDTLLRITERLRSALPRGG